MVGLVTTFGNTGPGQEARRLNRSFMLIGIVPAHSPSAKSSCSPDRVMQVVRGYHPFLAPMAGFIVTLPLRPD